MHCIQAGKGIRLFSNSMHTVQVEGFVHTAPIVQIQTDSVSDEIRACSESQYPVYKSPK